MLVRTGTGPVEELVLSDRTGTVGIAWRRRLGSGPDRPDRVGPGFAGHVGVLGSVAHVVREVFLFLTKDKESKQVNNI